MASGQNVHVRIMFLHFLLLSKTEFKMVKIPKLGIDIGSKNIGILLYTDDVALVAENETKLQNN